jgi:hypothetical protein
VLWFLIAAAVLASYGIGRYQPGRRASDWANSRQYDRTIRRHSTRWWARWLVLSAENIGWLIAHPVQGWHAWQHRNDPPPPLSPAPQFDPDWAAKRRAAAEDQAAP